MPQNAESGSLVIEHQGVPGDLVGAGWLAGSGLAAPLPLLDSTTLQSSKHHALRVPTSGWLRTWLTLANPTVRSQTATLSAFDLVSGARLARITQTIEAETVKTVSLVTLLGSRRPTLPKEVRITVDHPIPLSRTAGPAACGETGMVGSLSGRYSVRANRPDVTVRSGRDGLDPDEVGGACNHRRSVGFARPASPGRRMDSTA